MTKKLLFFLLVAVSSLAFQACSDDKDETVKTYDVSVKLAYPDGYEARDSVQVTITNSLNNTIYSAKTNQSGTATFNVPAGVYSAASTEVRSVSGVAYNFNGTGSITITDNWVSATPVSLALTMSKSSQIIIKELYTGGCQKDDGSGTFSMDQYVILYNNSDYKASLTNLCLGVVVPSNSNVSNYDYTNGVLSYTDWIPAGYGIWYFPNEVTLESGQQLVIALDRAIDNTTTYSKSINFANSAYYCTYDPEQFTNTSYYPAPSSLIPESHYLKAVRYSGVTANAWSLSNTSPAFFIFSTQGETPVEFAADADRTSLYNGSATQVRKKVPVDWVIDAVEVFRQGYTTNQKRLLATVDAGSVTHTNGQGYTLYRNVDKTATEALSSNSGKLVYSYTSGTSSVSDGTTDASGIDAEASIKQGARIIYKDTNNSTNDFHQRNKASLRD